MFGQLRCPGQALFEMSAQLSCPGQLLPRVESESLLSCPGQLPLEMTAQTTLSWTPSVWKSSQLGFPGQLPGGSERTQLPLVVVDVSCMCTGCATCTSATAVILSIKRVVLRVV